jgi:hypothetical protein
MHKKWYSYVYLVSTCLKSFRGAAPHGPSLPTGRARRLCIRADAATPCVRMAAAAPARRFRAACGACDGLAQFDLGTSVMRHHTRIDLGTSVMRHHTKRRGIPLGL